MRLIAVLSTVCHWPLSDFYKMKVGELLEWEEVFTEVQKEAERPR